MFRRKNAELREEVQSHLRMSQEEKMQLGASKEAARNAAMREFGNITLIEEVARGMWSGASLESFIQDVNYGLRLLMRSPGFAVTAILTLALGIGVNTAVFSIVNAVLLKPLPYANPEQLVVLAESKPNFDTGSISYLNFRDWQKQNHCFSGIAISRTTSFIVTGVGEAESISGDLLSSDFFSILGVKPLLGRMFLPGEDEVGAAPVALISEKLWRDRFAADPNLPGRGITLDGHTYTVVGVVPRTFDLVIPSFRTALVYVPIGQWGNSLLLKRGAGLGIHGIARLRNGVSIEQAHADMNSVAANLAAAYPDSNKGIGASVRPMKQVMVGQNRTALLVLQVAVGFVLLIACVNVANLLLARSTSRHREFGVRLALGAQQGRILRQLMTESVLLAAIAGALGLLLGKWSTKAALLAMPMDLPRASEVRMDASVLAFTVIASLLVGVAFGLAPALKMGTGGLIESLRSSGRAVTGARLQLQRAFVVVEMATALVLLIGAGLMIRSLIELWRVDPGFDPHHVLSFNVTLPPSMSAAAGDAIRGAFRELQQQTNSIPGIEESSYTWGALPFGYDDEALFWVQGQPKPATENEMNWALKYVVSPDYLKLMRISLLRGRFLSEDDTQRSQRVAVIDEEFARKFFANENPIGRRLNLGENSSVEIVGVVGHVKQWGLDTDAKESLRAELYLSLMQLPDAVMGQVAPGAGMLVRSKTDDQNLFSGIREHLRRFNNNVVVYGPQTLDESVASTLAARRFAMFLLSAFAAVAVLLASIGVYGVLSYLVGQRTQEIGVRMSLGAARGDVLRLILRDGARFTLVGLGLGLAASLILTRLMSSMLFGVSAEDPATYLGVSVLLCAVALLACYLPAHRAMNVNPVVALRHE